MSGASVEFASTRALTAADVAAAAQLACVLEVTAPKPGNVSPGRPFGDVGYEDFLASAAAIGEPLTGVGDRPLGATILRAVEATARWTRSNTNLGVILLLTPLARAAVQEKGVGSRFHADVPKTTPDPFFREAVRRELDATTVDDARDVYAAIRRASPGGLGRADAQDVAGEPTVTLLEAMRLAADRDAVAREYATGFDVTFTAGAPALARARRDGLAWDAAIVETFLTLLAASADTHIVRRGGAAAAGEVTRLARAALDAGGVRAAAGKRAIEEMDRELRGTDNVRNPGTTADLTAAAIFVVLLGGGWSARR